jgi:dipeptidyl-peptidase-4
MSTAATRLTRPAILGIACVLLATASASAQAKRFTIDDLYDPARKIDATGSVLSGVAWIDDAQFLWSKRADEETVEWLKADAERGQIAPLYDVAALESALAAIGIDAAEAKKLSRPRAFVFDQDKRSAILTVAGDLFRYELATATLTRLTSDPEAESDPAFSPDGRMAAFTRGGNLFVVDVATRRERALTTDGGPALLNGRLDWVYQEEVYGRGTFRAFWWSPDSTRLAFLQLDQRPVPEFTLVDHLPYRQDLEVFDYPKAGDPNPLVRLGVVKAVGGPVTWIDTGRYSAAEHLIVRVSWKPDSTRVVYQIQDREQTWMDVNTGDPSTGATRTLFRETTGAWVDAQAVPVWLKDDTFLWLSERDGWQHIYHYKADGALIRRVTSGEWEVRALHGVDERNGWVYFAGTGRSHIGLDQYRVRLDGSTPVRLSKPAGTHGATFNPSFSLYVGTWSDVTTPTQTRLHRADGSEVRVLEQNTIPSLAGYQLTTPELLQVKTRDGFVMEAMLIKPPDFDPSRTYPVYQHTYAGPHAPQVRNAWGGTTYLYHQMLAQHGVVVWVCDNRSASGKGAVSAWHAYKRLGETELADIEDGLSWLTRQKWVDASRIGINGWSYGGFMVSYALTHSTRFAMGIAGGSVTDWRDYDSIYTERYMLMPQHNADAYERTAPRKAARDLHGRLLLVHGTMDDNVHMQNTMQFAYALQKAGKPFELMVYPTQRHGVTDAAQARHMRGMMFDFVMRTLQPSGTGSTATSTAVSSGR